MCLLGSEKTFTPSTLQSILTFLPEDQTSDRFSEETYSAEEVSNPFTLLLFAAESLQ